MDTSTVADEDETVRVQLQNIVDLCGVIIDGASHPKQRWFNHLAAQLRETIFTPTSLTFTYDEANVRLRSAYCNSQPQLLLLLRDAMIKLRYSEAITILKTLLSSYPVRAPLAFEMAAYRAGMEIMQNTPSTVNSVIPAYVNQLKHLSSSLNTKQMMVEHTLFLLSNKRMDEAKECVGQMPQVLPSMRNTVGTHYATLLRRFLSGYIGYKDWVKLTATENTDQMNSQDSGIGSYTPYFEQMSQSQMTVGKICDDSLMDFENLDQRMDTISTGPLDMFIQPYIHLLVFKGRKQKAKEILRNYLHLRGENPNAYRYYIDFNTENRDVCDETELKTVLSEYVEKWPSDVEYAEKLAALKDTDNTRKVSMLFDLLDYPSNSDSVELWGRLEALILSDSVDRAVVKELWSSRSTWWSEFHMNYHPGEELKEVIRRVLALLAKYS